MVTVHDIIQWVAGEGSSCQACTRLHSTFSLREHPLVVIEYLSQLDCSPSAKLHIRSFAGATSTTFCDKDSVRVSELAHYSHASTPLKASSAALATPSWDHLEKVFQIQVKQDVQSPATFYQHHRGLIMPADLIAIS